MKAFAALATVMLLSVAPGQGSRVMNRIGIESAGTRTRSDGHEWPGRAVGEVMRH